LSTTFADPYGDQHCELRKIFFPFGGPDEFATTLGRCSDWLAQLFLLPFGCVRLPAGDPCLQTTPGTPFPRSPSMSLLPLQACSFLGSLLLLLCFLCITFNKNWTKTKQKYFWVLRTSLSKYLLCFF